MLQLVKTDGNNRLETTPVGTLIRRLMVGKSELTQKTYEADLEAFARFLGCARAEQGVGVLLDGGPEITYGKLLDYQDALKKKGLQNTSINRKLACVRSILALARETGLMDWSVRVRSLKVEPYRDTRGPGDNAMNQLIRMLQSKEGAKAARDLAIIRLLHDMALRRSEVTAIEMDDLDLNDGRVWIKGKGRSEKQCLEVPEAVRKAILLWLGFRGTDPGPLFMSLDHNRQNPGRISRTALNKILKAYGRSMGIDLAPHALRHAGITRAVGVAAEIGVTMPELLQYSRHKSLRTLQVYVDNHRNVQGRIASAVSASLG